MSRTINIRIIGVSLAVFYAVSYLIYLTFLTSPPSLNDLVLLPSLLILTVASLGILTFREWARRILIIFSALLSSFFLGLLLVQPRLVEPVFIFVNLAVIFFFNLVQVRASFHADLKFVRKSVLVIDDDEGFLRTVSRILLSKGYSVLTATTGERGFQIAKVQRPDLVILDVILPGIKGREVCIQLKEEPRTCGIPVIFVTAKDSPDDVAAEMAIGGDSHLTKPIDAKVLLTAVKNCLKE